MRQEEPFQIVSQCVPTLDCELLDLQFSVRRLDLEALEPVLHAALGIESKGVSPSDTVSSSQFTTSGRRICLSSDEASLFIGMKASTITSPESARCALMRSSAWLGARCQKIVEHVVRDHDETEFRAQF